MSRIRALIVGHSSVMRVLPTGARDYTREPITPQLVKGRVLPLLARKP